MKNLTALALILSLGAPAYAGGPVLVEEAYEAEPAPKLPQGAKIAIGVGLFLIIAAAASGGSKGGSVCYGDDVPTPEPC